jgi:hypothetical protein
MSNIKTTSEKLPNGKMILSVDIEVNDEGEACNIVSLMAIDYVLLGAKVNDKKEKFNAENLPFQFLKDNSKDNKKYRDVLRERGLKNDEE